MLWKGVSIGWNGFLSPLERWNHPSLVRGGQTTHQELDRVGTLARDQELGIHLDRSALSLDSRLYRLLRLNSMNVQFKSSGLAVIYLCSKKNSFRAFIVRCTCWYIIHRYRILFSIWHFTYFTAAKSTLKGKVNSSRCNCMQSMSSCVRNVYFGIL